MEYRTSRQHVVDMCRTMLERGYLKATEGNVSVRIPGHRLYAVTPSNYDYDKMRVEDICIVDFDGKHVPDDVGRRPRAVDRVRDARQHLPRAARRQRDRPHPPAVRLGAGLPPQADPGAHRRAGPLPRQARSRSSTTPRRAPASWPRTCRRRSPAATTRSSSPTTASSPLGTDPDRAVFNMALLEKVSIAYLLALTTEAGKVYTIPAAIREIAFTKLRTDEKRIAAQITEAVAPVRVPRRRGTAERRREGRRGRGGQPPAGDDRGRAGQRVGPARLRDQRVPRRRRHDAPAQGAGGPAGARPAARRDARRAQLLRHQVPGQQGDHRPGQAAHPRRRPAQPGLQLPVPARDRPGRGRLPDRPRRQHLHRLPAGRRPDDPGQQLRPGQRAGRRGDPRVRPGDRAVPRVRAEARRDHPPVHAAHRDVPLARLGHRGRDGRGPRRARLHRQEDGDQGRRRLPRLVRHDGLRPAGARHASG